MKLIIGNKNYSSWSLRPWLLLSVNYIPFEEIRIPLFTDRTHDELKKYTKAGKVPVLHDEDIIVWDSLAICEYVSEKYLKGMGWPEDIKSRATARSYCAEMHSGFHAIRNKMPMNCRASDRKIEVDKNLREEIKRIDHIWSNLLKNNSLEGSWLFGKFTIIDSMFAPLVFRFKTYNIALSDRAEQYLEYVYSNALMQTWLTDARNESERIELAELGMTLSSTSG